MALDLYNDLAIRDSTFASQGYIATLTELDKLQEAKDYYEMVNSSMSPTHKAQALFYLNELDSGFYYLNMAFEQRDPNMLFLKVEPHYDTVRDDLRFIEILNKMNFPVIDNET